MTSLAVVILTLNEERHVARALGSVSQIATETFVIDSGSTDATTDLARSAGACVLTHPFVSQAQQFQWALDNAPITADWVMRLDADEIIEPDLVAEIVSRLATLPQTITGVRFKRKHIFMDRWIRHGGRYPITLLRLWRRGMARVEQRWMDEHMLLVSGDAVTFEGGFADHNLNDLSFFIDKHNRYASREAIEILKMRYGLGNQDGVRTALSRSDANSVDRFLKDNVYGKLPFWLSSTAYFLFRYLVQLGFLDGREGLIYHGLQGGWYRFLVGAKVQEWDRTLRGLPDSTARLNALSHLTGYRLTG